MKYLVISIFLFCSSFLFAQDALPKKHLIGAVLGLDFTSGLSKQVTIDQTKPKLGFYGGVTYEYKAHKHFSFGADLIFNQRGFHEKLIYTDAQGNPTGSIYITHGYNYISLPIKLGIQTGGNIYGFCKLGIMPSLMVKTANSLPNHPTINPNTVVMDAAAVAELGIGFYIKQEYHIYVTVGYQQTFSTFNPNFHPDIAVLHNGFNTTVGFKYAFI